ncbi:hypothetical protein GLO73106DRAFT_00023500 [Gloeocapsa sp. PCC 73106]|nr:hypothetical protein GLO73106DRAFT_00023500 [Gloeocapsa sp. PCC 73106]
METNLDNNQQNFHKASENEGNQSKLDQYRQKLSDDPTEREALRSKLKEIDRAYEDFRTNGKLPDKWELLSR